MTRKAALQARGRPRRPSAGCSARPSRRRPGSSETSGASGTCADRNRPGTTGATEHDVDGRDPTRMMGADGLSAARGLGGRTGRMGRKAASEHANPGSDLAQLPGRGDR
jgi:hypothetical protein